MESTVTSANQMEEEGDQSLELPIGFRFHPRDEEIITYYLTPKVFNHGFGARAIGEVDLNKCEPWDLPSMAKMGEKEWYFFCHKDKKYPTGMRTNRATEAGYWKATGKDKEIYRGTNHMHGSVLVGMKKTLVFYKGRAPRGGKTNWVMHEYRLDGKLPFSKDNTRLRSSKDEWVVCKVFNKGMSTHKKSSSPMHGTNCIDYSTELHTVMMNQRYYEQDRSRSKLMASENVLAFYRPDIFSAQNLVLYQQHQLQSLGSYSYIPSPNLCNLNSDGAMHGVVISHRDLDGLVDGLDSCFEGPV